MLEPASTPPALFPLVSSFSLSFSLIFSSSLFFLCSIGPAQWGDCLLSLYPSYSPLFFFLSHYLLCLLCSCLFLALAFFVSTLFLSLSWDLSRSPTCWACCCLLCASFTAHLNFLPVTPRLPPPCTLLRSLFTPLFPSISSSL